MLKTTAKIITHKITLITIVIIILTIISLIAASLILFLNLDKYKSDIERNLSSYTGYKITTATIGTSLYNNFQPELVIADMQVSESNNKANKISIKRIDLILSYASIWKMSPIFSKIIVVGTKLNFNRLGDGSLLVNGLQFKQTSNNSSSFDIEQWLLQQKEIIISKLDFSFADVNSDIPRISFYNIFTKLKRSYDLRNTNVKHNLDVKLYNDKLIPILGMNLMWLGNKLTSIESIPLGTLVIRSYTNTLQTPLTNTAIKLPSSLVTFNGETAINAKVENGRLLYLKANFNTQNLQKLLTSKYTSINFPKFGGDLNIWLAQKENLYKIQAKNLNLATSSGDILKNTNINGWYLNKQKGELTTNDINLELFNHFLNVLPVKLLNIKGMINQFSFNWSGDIFKPTAYAINTNFSGVAILSKSESIPSINNISGTANISNESGMLNLNLNNSQLKYNYVFGKTITITTHSQISWLVESNSKIKFTLPLTTITTSDFSGEVSGNYYYESNSLGYINLKAHVNQVHAQVVPLYLPKQIGTDVINWLKMALVKGTGNNGNLVLNGNLSDFPYEESTGLFYITTDVKDGTLRYLNDWAPINNINGSFTLRNANITIKATSATAKGAKVTNALAVIPDMVADKSKVVVDGQATGPTQAFLNYLASTPLNDILGDLPSQTKALGNGNLNLHLNIPLDKPKSTLVNGNYNFKQNTIKFDLPIPQITNTNGKLYFTQRALTIKEIKARVLNSEAKLNASTDNKEIFSFNLDAPKVDYNELSKFYLPYLKNFISGSADTKVNFKISSKGLEELNAKTKLQGVTIQGLQDLSKHGHELKDTNLKIVSTNKYKGLNIKYNYGVMSQGNINFINNKLTNSVVQIGLNPDIESMGDHPPAKLAIKIRLGAMSVDKWMATIKKFDFDTNTSSTTNQSKLNNKSSLAKPTHNSATTSNNDVFPILISINTANLLLGKSNLAQAKASILVKSQATLFAMNNNYIRGSGTFYTAQNKLNLNLDKLIIPEESSSNNQESSSIKKVKSSTAKESATKLPSMNVKIKQLALNKYKLGNFAIQLINKGHDSIIQNGSLGTNNFRTSISGVVSCINNCPTNQKTVTNLNTHTEIKNISETLKDLNYKGNMIDKGKGSIDAKITWNGGIPEFKFYKSTIQLKAKFTDGTLLEVNTNDLFGQILKLINLQAIFDIARLNFKKIVSKGFDFNEITIDSEIKNGIVNVKEFKMSGNIASVHSKGQIDLNTNKLDLTVVITPKLATGVAIGAAIITANPLVGLLAFLSEKTLDTPIGKILSLNYHLSGTIDKPKLNAKSAGEQIKDNVKSTVTKN